MNAVEFLRTIWPASGPYCLVTGPFLNKKTGLVTSYWHHPFTRIEDAAAFATSKSVSTNVYHANHAFKELGFREYGGTQFPTIKREQANARCARCFYFDIDCGKDKDGKWKPYKTREEGFQALKNFLKVTGLPKPMVVNSGNGWHCYWLLVDEIDSITWTVHANVIKALMAYHQFMVDTAVTADSARVLRVIGTYNRKDPANPIKVKLHLPQAERIRNDEFLEILARAAVDLPAAGSTERTFEPAEKPAPMDVAKECPSFIRMVDEAKNGRGVVWMALNNLSLHTTGGAALAHKLAKDHPTYNRDETQAKLDRLIEQNFGPMTCAKIEALYPENSPCLDCQHYGTPGSSPIVFARRRPKTELPAELPPPQPPYARTKRGIEYQPPQGALPTQPPPIVICPYDLYPIMIVDQERDATKGVTWVAELPFRGKIEFQLPIAIYNDERTLIELMANQGVVIDKRHAKNVGGYVSHYIKLLQAHAAEHVQFETFGWPKDKSCFVAGENAITKDGFKPAVLAPGLANMAAHMKSGGTLAGQIKTLEFYAHPDYVRQQFLIVASLGAPLMVFTDLFGVIINASGESGASKSTALYAAASLWGRGERYAMSAGETESTANGQANRIRILANCPICLDEITLMSPERIKALAMSITQPETDKLRLTMKGRERLMPDTLKSSVMICTSNNSPHALLSINSAAGAAGSMRVYDMPCPRLGRHTKTQADQFIRDMRQHYGWIGPAVMLYVVQNMAAVEREVHALMAYVDRVGEIQPSERYWAAAIVEAVMGARLARRLDMLPYDPDYILNWSLTVQLPLMRKAVRSAYQSPIDILHNYIGHIQNNILSVYQSDPKYNTIWVPERKIMGALKGRLETINGTLYLATHFFREYCDERKLPVEATINVLVERGVVTRDRIDLSRYISEYTGGQVHVLKVDLTHEMMAGKAPIGDKVIQFPGKRPLDKD